MSYPPLLKELLIRRLGKCGISTVNVGGRIQRCEKFLVFKVMKSVVMHKCFDWPLGRQVVRDFVNYRCERTSLTLCHVR